MSTLFAILIDLALIGVLLWVVLMLAAASRSDREEPEPGVCACGHSYYDHAHYWQEQPCAALMCSCPSYNPPET
jgi:hypothetical protein